MTAVSQNKTVAPDMQYRRRICHSDARRALYGLLAAALITMLAAPLTARAALPWWNGDWQYRKAISIKLPSETAAGVPSTVVLPIRLHAGNFQFFQDMQPNAADLRFIAGDGTPLKHQLELLDPAAGVLVAWVALPVQAGATDQTIWMYYGNPHAPPPDSAGLYDADQMVVLHFAESQGPPQDATANRYDAATSSAQLGVPGVIGSGIHLDGQSAVRIAARPGLALAPGGGLAVAAWVQLEGDQARAVLYSQAQGDRHVEIGIANAKLYAELKDGKHTNRVESSGAVAAGRWQHLAVSIGSDVALYIDGAPAGSAAAGALPSLAADVLIGGLADPKGAGGLKGQLDEVEISKAPRSAWWVRTSALAQSPDTTLMAYGTDESKGSAGKFAAYVAMMRNLFAQVSLDGLVVITITVLMGLASLQVMTSKAALLGRVERQDRRFLAQFPERFGREVEAAASGDKAREDDAYQASGLYEMYRAGLGGVRAIAEASGGTRAASRLSHEGFEAIRAALDSGLVEASNRLNARLVVMTVAIAGAPFLGLLGTVVGVMVTFASIAAAGDVNVNTIAPGVAAAMTATVAGLLVAIPSLFGYNWLATRIARRTSAMEVFADQFVSRLALLGLSERSPVPSESPLDARPTIDLLDADHRSTYAA